jgi:arylsulfatase A-like enzyme
MTRRDTVLLALTVLLPSAQARAEAPAAPATPNVVLILSDDLGRGSVGCYGADPKLVRTPAIDRLAKEGRRFTDACTPSSVCSPTRYAVLTGRYCWRTSLQHEVLGVYSPLLIETTRPTIASLLKRKGYATAAIGKWHLGYGSAPRTDYTAELAPGPLDIGFNYHFSVPSNHGDITGVFVEDRKVAGLRSAALKPFGQCYYGGKPFVGLDAPQREDEKVMEVLTDRAVAWLDRQEDAKPFFLYFTPVAVHEPSTPSARTKGTSGCGPYGDWIHDLDLSVGRILEALDRKNLAGNTLVIFSSDNGGVLITEGDRPEAKAYAAGLRVSGPLRGRKHSVYEGGFRVPFVARWPGRVPAGTVCDETIGLVDLFATVSAIVGEPLPPAATGAEDSFNVLPALLGEKTGQPLRPDLVEHSADGNFAIRQGPWKWIEGKYHPDTKPGVLKARAPEFKPQLYNLRDDPGEQTDVLETNTETAHRLSERLDAYRRQGHSRP